MRFLDYMKISSNEEESIFRSLKIDIVDDDDNFDDIIDQLSLKYKYINESMDIINEINKDFKKIYSGKYKYGFCIDKKTDISEIKIKKSYKNVIYKKYFEVNERFNDIKKRFEKELSFNIK